MELTLISSLLVKPLSPQNVSVSSGILPTVLKLSWENWISDAVMTLKFNIRYRITGDTSWMEVIPLVSLAMILLWPSHLSNCSSLCCSSEHSPLFPYVLHGHPRKFIWPVHEGCDLGIFWHSLSTVTFSYLCGLFCCPSCHSAECLFWILFCTCNI